MNKSASLLAAVVAASAVSTHAANAPNSSPAANALRDFNPAMSVILDGVYHYDSISGDAPGLIEEHSNALHSDGPEGEEEFLDQGFNLREIEFTVTGSVDSYFDAWLTAIFNDDEIKIEEAWIRTQSLPYGFTVKAGKFLSALGYHNEKHVHSWDFIDQNLAYLSLISDEGLGDAGVQISWLAPTPFFLETGFELLQGGGQERFGAELDGEELAELINEEFMLVIDEDDLNLPTRQGPRFGVAYLRFSPDLGTRQGLQLGASISHTDSQQIFRKDGTDAFLSEDSGNLYGLQAVYKRFATGAYGKGYFDISGEVFAFESEQNAVFHTDPLQLGIPVELRQKAAYVQANWGVAPRWRLAVRQSIAGFDSEVVEDGNSERIGVSRQFSGAITWLPTEFSKVRLQFNHNDIAGEDGRRHANQVMLQYNMSLGAHGAHKF